MKNENADKNQDKNRDANRDPITKTPGAHPIGTGIGAAAGGAATGAAIGSVAGPIGTAVGIAAGAVAGGLVGKGVAEHFDPTEEDAYWRDHYTNEPYVQRDYTYDDYQPAYRSGYDAYARYGQSGRQWDEVEPDLRTEYERNRGQSRLNWEQAKSAARAAWERLATRTQSGTYQNYNYERLIGYEVIDSNDEKIGTVNHLWTDNTGQPAFLGIKTGWLFGKTHVVPVHSAEVNEYGQVIRLPFTEEQVKGSASYDPDADLLPADEEAIYRYYNLQPQSTTTTETAARDYNDDTYRSADTSTRTRAEERLTETGMETGRRTESQEETRIPLREEQVTIGKRDIESGGVRLRKVVRTEVVNQPVELQREEIVLERVPASEGQTAATEGSFEEREVFIPLRREEAVVSKENRVREEVRVGKQVHTEKQTISENVRKEDVEVVEGDDATRRGRGRTSRTDNP